MVEEMVKRWDQMVVYRADVDKFSFGTVSPMYQAVLDCKGQGPERFKIGRKIAYDVDTYADWLQARYFDNKKQ
jgi:hypothetical protein